MNLLRGLRLAPEGADVIVISLVLFLLIVVLVISIKAFVFKILLLLSLVWLIAVLQFFRDPVRVSPNGDGIIIAPADGKIIDVSSDMFRGENSLLIARNEETKQSKSLDKFNSKSDQDGSTGEIFATRIAIFMSPINVHVNRSPVSGKILDVEYRKGKFITAFNPESERVNERTLITMQTNNGKMAFSQVAGYLARRIIFHPQKGDTLKMGERVGMIRFGSRSDIYLPDNVKVLVKPGQKVKAGVTILGEFTNED